MQGKRTWRHVWRNQPVGAPLVGARWLRRAAVSLIEGGILYRAGTRPAPTAR